MAWHAGCWWSKYHCADCCRGSHWTGTPKIIIMIGINYPLPVRAQCIIYCQIVELWQNAAQELFWYCNMVQVGIMHSIEEAELTWQPDQSLVILSLRFLPMPVTIKWTCAIEMEYPRRWVAAKWFTCTPVTSHVVRKPLICGWYNCVSDDLKHSHINCT